MNRWLEQLALLSPGVTEPPDTLSSALAVLDVHVNAATLVAAAESLTGAVLVGAAVLALLVPDGFRLAVLILGSAVAVGAWWLLVRGPLVLAAARRRRALGTAPWLVCVAAMRLRVTPTTESAAAFAARHDDRMLAWRLGVHVRRARGTARTGFEGFRAEWGEQFPPLDRAVASLQAAAVAPDGDRDAAIERALETVLDGVRHHAADDAAALQGPVTALYAFGVLLPLALVAALPAAAVAGLPVTVPVLVVGYDLLLPAGLVGASIVLVARRPVTFPAVTVPRDHPAVPEQRWPSAVAGVLAGSIASGVVSLLVAPWAVPVAGLGIGGGVALVVRFSHERRVRERVAEIETTLPTVLTRAGRALGDGQPIELALDSIADTVSAPGDEPIAAAVGRMDRLGIGIEDAFLGEHGTLATVPSPRAVGTARLLAAAAREGRPAGTALVAGGTTSRPSGASSERRGGRSADSPERWGTPLRSSGRSSAASPSRSRGGCTARSSGRPFPSTRWGRSWAGTSSSSPSS